MLVGREPAGFDLIKRHIQGWANAGFQEPYQFLLHIIIVVGYIEDDQAFVFQERLKKFFNPGLVGLFHTENHVRPFDQIAADRGRGGFVGSSADGLYSFNFIEDCFGGGAAEFVGGADEEEIHGLSWPFPLMLKIHRKFEANTIVISLK